MAVAGGLLAGRIWTGESEVRAIGIGLAAAWAASSVSVAWLLWARGRESKIFWRAFGGGMALRAATLGALAVWGYERAGLAYEALLLSFVFGLLALLLTLEMRHLRIR